LLESKVKVAIPVTLVEKVLISKLKKGDCQAFSDIFTALEFAGIATPEELTGLSMMNLLLRKKVNIWRDMSHLKTTCRNLV
jgi:hypothetical protein